MHSMLLIERKPLQVLKPQSGWAVLDLREIWQFRNLLLTLAARDLKLRYRQTALGPVWVVLGPLLSAGVLSFVFGKIANLPSEGVPYFLFLFAGQQAWNVFNNTLGRIGGSLVGNAHLVSKVYFPRMVLPLSTIFSTLVDLGVALALLVVLMIVLHVAPTAALLLLPVWLILLLAFAMGIGLIIAALTVTYRDAGGFIAPLLSAMMYLSPVLYSVTAMPQSLRPFLPFYYLNPMASLIQGFRWSLLGTSAPPWGYVVYAAVLSFAVLAAGMFAFRSMERKFADVI